MKVNNEMSTFDEMFEDIPDEVVAGGLSREGLDKPPKKPSKKMKPTNLDAEMIAQVMRGGSTIDEEINRPFWKFPQLPPYPYDHFIPAFVLIVGMKGASKTSCALSFPGNIFALTFEKRGNLTRPWTKIFANDPRIQPFGVSEYIQRGSVGGYRDTSSTVYLKVVELMIRAIKHTEKFDWVLIDGLQSGHRITTQRMKSLNRIGAFENLPTKLLTRWGERTIYLENIVVDLACAIAKKGVIMSSQDVMGKPMFITKEEEKAGVTMDDIKAKDPKWMVKIKEDADTIVINEIVEEKLGRNRIKLKWQSTITTNKLGAVGRYDITLHDDPKATINLIKEILTSDIGFKPISYE